MRTTLALALVVLLMLATYMYAEAPTNDIDAESETGAPLTPIPVDAAANTVEQKDVVPKAAENPTEADVWKRARATVFWVGEAEDDDNGFIHNRSSAWDADWEQHFGGYDDPNCRNGFLPCGFTPHENPFYVALPFNDIAEDGMHKIDIRIPTRERRQWVSELKNRWIAVQSGMTVCYAQWQDVGPFGEDDIEYVFGTTQKPINTQGVGAGIDLSPAVRDCLGVDGLSDVLWRHVEARDVPPGPWLTIVTR